MWDFNQILIRAVCASIFVLNDLRAFLDSGSMQFPNQHEPTIKPFYTRCTVHFIALLAFNPLPLIG